MKPGTECRVMALLTDAFFQREIITMKTTVFSKY